MFDYYISPPSTRLILAMLWMYCTSLLFIRMKPLPLSQMWIVKNLLRRAHGLRFFWYGFIDVQGEQGDADVPVYGNGNTGPHTRCCLELLMAIAFPQMTHDSNQFVTHMASQIFAFNLQAIAAFAS